MADERAQLAILGIDFEALDADSNEFRLSPVNVSPIGTLRPPSAELNSGHQSLADHGPEPYAAFGAGGRAMSISPDGSIAAGSWQRAPEAATGAAPAVTVAANEKVIFATSHLAPTAASLSGCRCHACMQY